MSRKAVFVDVDGTLLDENAQVPESAGRAIRRARENGHLVFLSTGRCRGQIWKAVRDIGFDGMVGSAGAFVQVGERVVSHRGFTTEDVGHIQHFFHAHGTGFYLEASDRVFADPDTVTRLHAQMFGAAASSEVADEMRGGPLEFLYTIEGLDRVDELILKVMYFDSDLPLDAVADEFAPTLQIVPASTDLLGPRAGEMMLAGITKATGMRDAIEHLGIGLPDTIALGDSYNDIEMLEAAGVGIAMGNAPSAVAASADEHTAPPQEDGVWLAFERHGLTTA